MRNHNRVNFVLGFASLSLVLGGIAADGASAAIIPASQDSFINEGQPTANYDGSGLGLYVVNYPGVPDLFRRTVMSFDLSSFTSDSNFVQFTSATLELGVPIQSGSGTHAVYRLLRDINETQVTWNQASTGNNWQTPGASGAADRVQIATGVNGGSSSGTEWANGGLDVLTATNTWTASPDTTELGFLIVSENNYQVWRYENSEGAAGSGGPGPVLVVEAQFVPEPGAAALVGLGLGGVALRRGRRAARV